MTNDNDAAGVGAVRRGHNDDAWASSADDRMNEGFVGIDVVGVVVVAGLETVNTFAVGGGAGEVGLGEAATAGLVGRRDVVGREPDEGVAIACLRVVSTMEMDDGGVTGGEQVFKQAASGWHSRCAFSATTSGMTCEEMDGTSK